jgi:hypothetical protein
LVLATEKLDGVTGGGTSRVLVATTVLAALLLVSMTVAAFTKVTLARAYVVLGSALAVLLIAITGNVVGAFGLEVSVLLIGLVFTGLTTRRRVKATHRRQRRREAWSDVRLAA